VSSFIIVMKGRKSSPTQKYSILIYMHQLLTWPTYSTRIPQSSR